MKKINLIFLFTFLIQGCSSVDWKNEDSTKNWLVGKTLQITGDLVFKENGNFEMIPYSPNDPTQHYYGKWELGNFHTYPDGSGELRDLTLIFNTHGWVTDNYTDSNGQRYAGFGNRITGSLHEVNGKYYFSVTEARQKDNMYIDMNSGEELTGSTSTTDYEFK